MSYKRGRRFKNGDTISLRIRNAVGLWFMLKNYEEYR